MTTRRLGFIGVVAALAVCWAAAAGESAQKCKSMNPKQDFPATGQTTSSPRPPYHAGDDGDIQAGATLSYTDNGDGTITDNNTCLMWEKKSDDGSIHDKDNAYTWDNAFDMHLNGINGLNTTNFAGYNDWRLPNVKELQSIVNYENDTPAVSPEFHNNTCLPGCTVLTCSCTSSSYYWSATALAVEPEGAWDVDFEAGFVDFDIKSDTIHSVRAVRGGSNLGSSR